MATATEQQPVRAGIFNSVEKADKAVTDLLAAGFRKDQISVICSNKVREEFFDGFKHPPLPADSLGPGVVTGGGIGALAGSLTALAGVATATGIGLFVVGPILIGAATGAVVGGFIGAMTTRGFTRETADFYDQALTQGKILVSVQEDGEKQASRLAKAEAIFKNAGAEPVPLTE